MEKQLKISIPEDLRTRLKVMAATRGVTVRQVVIQLIERWLREKSA